VDAKARKPKPWGMQGGADRAPPPQKKKTDPLTKTRNWRTPARISPKTQIHTYTAET